MLSCKQLVAHSSEFLDGQLSLRKRMSVRLHLAMCEHCRRFIKQMRLSQAVLQQLPRGKAPNSISWLPSWPSGAAIIPDWPDFASYSASCAAFSAS